MADGLLIATPMYAGQCFGAFADSRQDLAVQLALAGIPSMFTKTANESLITRGRNVIAETFMQSEYDTLLFIDSDIEFTTEDVGKLWKLNVPVACGVYTMKKVGAPFAAWHKGKLVTNLEQFDGPIEVDKAGTGFLMIKRAAFDTVTPWVERETRALIEAFAKVYDIPYQDAAGRVLERVTGVDTPVRRFFSQAIVPYDPGEAIELSEDYSFCERWTRIGGKIVMDPSVRLWHHGTFRYGR